MEKIKKLESNQVFVFGSNEQGFHGAGAAGFACRGDSRNNWRSDEWFLKAIKSANADDRIGKWAVFGVAKGYQEGREGKSYAIVTIKKPGLKRSVSRRDIYYQLVKLIKFAMSRSDLEFLVTPLGCGLAGYTVAEMDEVWKFLFEKHGKPPNLILIEREITC